MSRGQFTLAIETSTPIGSVALGRGEELLAEITLGRGARHAEHLLPAIDSVFRIAALDRHRLERVVVGAGPGSFTGLRIAAATAKGLASTRALEFLAYSGLLAVAAGTGLRDQPVCALFDARRDQVYAACYRLGDRVETLRTPCADDIAAVLSSLSPDTLVFAGDGAGRHADRIAARGGRIMPGEWAAPRASVLLWLARCWPELGAVADAAHWEPHYVRGSSAERGVHG